MLFNETNNLNFLSNIDGVNLTFSRAGIAVTNENWFAQPRFSAFTRVYYVVEGSGVLYSDEEQTEIEPNHVYICPMGMKYGFYGTPSINKLYFHISAVTPDGSDIFSRFHHIIKLPCTVEHTKHLEKLYISSDIYDHFQLKGEVFKTVSDAIRKAYTTSNQLSNNLNSAINYIRQNLSANLTVEDVASAVFVSRKKLNDLFKNELGQQASVYIDELVMSEAHSMLQYTDKTIGEISAELGFTDQFYFSRKFKKFYGTTPSKLYK